MENTNEKHIIQKNRRAYTQRKTKKGPNTNKKHTTHLSCIT